MSKYALIITDFTKHIIAQKHGKTTSHAKNELFNKSRGQIKSNKNFYIIIKCLDHIKISMKTN